MNTRDPSAPVSMIVRDWMQQSPLTCSGDMLVSEAKRLLSENNLHALPVVDDGGCAAW